MLRETPTTETGHDERQAAASPASDRHAAARPASATQTATMAATMASTRAATMAAALADCVLRCRELADTIGAAGFSLLFIAAEGETRRLAPVFDSAFPGVSALSRALSSPAVDRLARQLAVGAMPVWWRSGDAGMLSPDCHGWAHEAASPLAGTALADQPGIVFPVGQENGRAGAVAFYGRDVFLDADALCEAHAGCFALFSDIATRRPPGGAQPPAISKREIECLRLTANGFTSEEIAAELGLSVHTANQYLTSSAHKLNAVSRIHAVAKALRAGLID